MKDMVKQFFSWFQNLGGTVPPNFEEVLNTRYIYDPEPVSSFKNRAEYIKKKYNHKFKLKSIHDKYLEQEPDISKLKFDKK